MFRIKLGLHKERRHGKGQVELRKTDLGVPPSTSTSAPTCGQQGLQQQSRKDCTAALAKVKSAWAAPFFRKRRVYPLMHQGRGSFVKATTLHIGRSSGQAAMRAILANLAIHGIYPIDVKGQSLKARGIAGQSTYRKATPSGLRGTAGCLRQSARQAT